MFDIGLGEMLVLGIGALLIFGPERLPRSAADFVQTIRKVQAVAKSTRQSIVDVAGADVAEGREALKGMEDLHPRRLLSSVFDDDAKATPPPGPAVRRLPTGYVRAAEARKALESEAESPPEMAG